MGRMGAQGQSDDDRSQAKITFRVDEEKKAAYKEALDVAGESMSGDLRAHVEAVVEGSNPDNINEFQLPDDDQLADAYRALRRHADPDRGTVDTEIAETIAAEATRVRAAVVRANVLEPLKRRGFIVPKWGKIRVVPPAEVDDRAVEAASP